MPVVIFPEAHTALRVGADAFASDLNPVPVLLNKIVLEYIPKYGRRLADEVRKWREWIKRSSHNLLIMNSARAALAPLLCAPLLRKVDAKLIELLHSLSAGEWDMQTIARSWKVRDVAAHLLDTALRKLSMVRDSCVVETVSVRSPQDLIELVDRLNAEGVKVFRRLSPPVLIEMMQIACEQSAQFHETLDPFAVAAFPVSWAGESVSLNWFDTARELTERWHHQQQIRLATDRPGIMVPELYHPVLDCFLRGLPHLYRDVHAADGIVLSVEVPGDCGGVWYMCREPEAWRLALQAPDPPCARVIIPQEIAWRVFTKGMDRQSARSQIAIEGDSTLAERVLELSAIVG